MERAGYWCWFLWGGGERTGERGGGVGNKGGNQKDLAQNLEQTNFNGPANRIKLLEKQGFDTKGRDRRQTCVPTIKVRKMASHLHLQFLEDRGGRGKREKDGGTTT